MLWATQGGYPVALAKLSNYYYLSLVLPFFLMLCSPCPANFWHPKCVFYFDNFNLNVIKTFFFFTDVFIKLSVLIVHFTCSKKFISNHRNLPSFCAMATFKLYSY